MDFAVLFGGGGGVVIADVVGLSGAVFVVAFD